MEGNKKVLVVTYYWPPSAGSGVQRWLKFVKFLPQFGWEPFILTPQNPSFSLRDESLSKNIPPEAKVVKLPIWEPYNAFNRIANFAGKENDQVMGSKKRSLFGRASTWIRGNFIVPDPRVFWVKPAVRFLKQFVADNNIQVVVTTGPPHSMHLIGYYLKKELPSIRWIADFRDPWSEWGLLDSLSVSPMVRRIHRKLERKVLTAADMVTTITPFYVRHFERLGKRKVELLTNGFDEEDFKNFQIVRPDKFTIRHMGIVNEKCDPRPVMDVISKMCEVDNEFARNLSVEFIGEVNPAFRAYVDERKFLSEVTRFVPTVPHRDLQSFYASSSVLLLVLVGYKDAEGYMPGKLFEYIATGLPVLGVGPVEGDAGNLMTETKSGVMLSENNVKAIEAFISENYSKWKAQIPAESKKASFENYSRRGVTAKLSRLLQDQLML